VGKRCLVKREDEEVYGVRFSLEEGQEVGGQVNKVRREPEQQGCQ